ITRAEDRQARSRRNRLATLRRIRDEDPDVSILVLAGKLRSEDAIYFKLVASYPGRNFAALPAMHVKAPAVIRAFQQVAFQAAAGKRHAAMRAGVAHCERFTLCVAPNRKRFAQQHRLAHSALSNAGAEQ